MNDIEETQRAACFVRLKMSDQVPMRVGPSHFRDLAFGILNTILAEVGSAEFDELLNQTRRMSLADGDQRHLVWAAATSLRSGRDSSFNVRKSCGKTGRRVNVRY